MLMLFASHSVRIAIAASPAPRRAALIRKSNSTVTLPPSITRVNVPPVATTPGEAPMRTSNRGPSVAPRAPTITASPTPSTIACTAALAAPRGSPPPRRAARPPRALLAGASRDHRRDAHRQPHGERVDDHQHRFGQADRSDGVGAELRHPEDVHHREHRLHDHLDDHRDG